MERKMERKVPEFISKLWKIVEDHQYDDVISWTPDGTGFLVNKNCKSRLETDIFPEYFKHQDFSSFLRQLSTYGFRKNKETKAYSHAHFNRHHPEKLTEITFKKRGKKQSSGNENENSRTLIPSDGVNSINQEIAVDPEISLFEQFPDIFDFGSCDLEPSLVCSNRSAGSLTTCEGVEGSTNSSSQDIPLDLAISLLQQNPEHLDLDCNFQTYTANANQSASGLNIFQGASLTTRDILQSSSLAVDPVIDVLQHPANWDVQNDFQRYQESVVTSEFTDTSFESGISSAEDVPGKRELGNVTIHPNEGPLEGGESFYVEFDKSLPDSEISAWVQFGHNQVVAWKTYERQGNTLHGKKIPRGDKPGPVTVTITANNGDYLGETIYTYVDGRKESNENNTVNINKRKLADFFDEFAKRLRGDDSEELQTHDSEQGLRISDILQHLSYTTEGAGAKEIIEAIFNLPVVKIFLESGNNESPSQIIEAHSNQEEIASYLPSTARRLPDDDERSRTYSNVLDWINLADGCGVRSGTSLEESVTKDDDSETSYLGDEETSSVDLSEEDKDDFDHELETRHFFEGTSLEESVTKDNDSETSYLGDEETSSVDSPEEDQDDSDHEFETIYVCEERCRDKNKSPWRFESFCISTTMTSPQVDDNDRDNDKSVQVDPRFLKHFTDSKRGEQKAKPEDKSLLKSKLCEDESCEPVFLSCNPLSALTRLILKDDQASTNKMGLHQGHQMIKVDIHHVISSNLRSNRGPPLTLTVYGGPRIGKTRLVRSFCNPLSELTRLSLKHGQASSNKMGLDPNHQMTEDDIHDFELPDEIVLKWKDLARALGYREANIKSIENEKGNSNSECCIELLERWLYKKGRDATAGILAEALTRIEHKNLAGRLMKSNESQSEKFEKSIRKMSEKPDSFIDEFLPLRIAEQGSRMSARNIELKEVPLRARIKELEEARQQERGHDKDAVTLDTKDASVVSTGTDQATRELHISASLKNLNQKKLDTDVTSRLEVPEIKQDQMKTLVKLDILTRVRKRLQEPCRDILAMVPDTCKCREDLKTDFHDFPSYRLLSEHNELIHPVADLGYTLQETSDDEKEGDCYSFKLIDKDTMSDWTKCGGVSSPRLNAFINLHGQTLLESGTNPTKVKRFQGTQTLVPGQNKQNHVT